MRPIQTGARLPRCVFGNESGRKITPSPVAWPYWEGLWGVTSLHGDHGLHACDVTYTAREESCRCRD